MVRKVIWAHSAEKDLDAVAEYIHRDSPAYAAAFVHRILKTGRSLSEFAERGRVVPEFKNHSLREIFVHSYRLIYRIEEERVSILALIHGRRDFDSAWSEKER